MNESGTNPSVANGERLALSGWLLLALVVALPLMKPALAYPIVLTDLIFLMLAASLALDVASRRRRFHRDDALLVLAAYVLALAPSMFATSDIGRSAIKLASEAYLAGLAFATLLFVRSTNMMRRVVLAWLMVTALLVVLAIASLVAFRMFPDGPLYAYSRYHLGTLPPGRYARLALTFFNANMACNYLTVSLGLLFVAWKQAWLKERQAWSLLGGILVAASSTLSAGLGGIALALGSGFWLVRGWRIALLCGIAAALAFLFAATLTPFVHPTAPFVIHLPDGLALAPSGRWLTWSAALSEFLRNPLVGHGIGIEAVSVHYVDPSGNLQHLTDAHNVILGIAAQAGLVGVAGLAVLLGYALRLTVSPREAGRDPLSIGLGLTFFNAFLYQGLTGSFEDARHLWVLLGLLIAASRLPVIRADGSSRISGVPSPG